jgi:hypothetical protein
VAPPAWELPIDVPAVAAADIPAAEVETPDEEEKEDEDEGVPTPPLEAPELDEVDPMAPRVDAAEVPPVGLDPMLPAAPRLVPASGVGLPELQPSRARRRTTDIGPTRMSLSPGGGAAYQGLAGAGFWTCGPLAGLLSLCHSRPRKHLFSTTRVVGYSGVPSFLEPSWNPNS